MATHAQNDRLLNYIIVYGFSAAFGLVIASLQALQPTPTGFTIELSWWTLLTMVAGAAIMLPFFRIIVHSRRKYLRRCALTVVVLVGLIAFFYPMRVVPPDKMRPVFTGLAVAVVALSIMAGLLFSLHRFFEREEKQHGG